MGLGDEGRAPSRGRRCCSRSSSPAKRRPAASTSRFEPVDAADPRARPLPPEGVRRRRADPRRAAPDPGRRARADRELVLRHGRQLRLRGRHHEVSMQMAEASLLPAVRDAPDAIVVADGTSCRHQIADGAGREAIHVARLLEQALPPPAGPRRMRQSHPSARPDASVATRAAGQRQCSVPRRRRIEARRAWRHTDPPRNR